VNNLSLDLTYLEACVLLKQVDKVKDHMDRRIIVRVAGELETYVESIREQTNDYE
jgi:hypothetical protein